MMIRLLNKVKGQKGFTLIELLVVVAILGILAAIAVPRFVESQKAARGSKIVADLRTIDSAITMSFANSSTAPTSASLVSNGYLASFPKPASGDVKYPNGTTATIASDAAYSIDIVTAADAAAGTAASTVYRANLSKKVMEDLTN